MANDLFLISEKADDLAFAEAVASISDLRVIKSTISELAGLPVNATIFWAVGHDQDRAVVEHLIKDRHPSSMHILFPTAWDLTRFLTSSRRYVGNYICKQWSDAIEAGLLYGQIVRSHRAPPDGLKFLAPETAIETYPLLGSLQKRWAVSALQMQLRELKVKSLASEVIANAADELLMNAIFDAPVDTQGNPIHQMASAEDFPLEGRNRVTLELAKMNSIFCVGATDYYGSLRLENICSHIAKTFDFTSGNMTSQSRSAGLGLASIFKSGGSIHISCQAGVRTDACALFPLEVVESNRFQFLSVNRRD